MPDIVWVDGLNKSIGKLGARKFLFLIWKVRPTLAYIPYLYKRRIVGSVTQHTVGYQLGRSTFKPLYCSRLQTCAERLSFMANYNQKKAVTWYFMLGARKNPPSLDQQHTHFYPDNDIYAA
jgi:hypothetical protein